MPISLPNGDFTSECWATVFHNIHNQLEQLLQVREHPNYPNINQSGGVLMFLCGGEGTSMTQAVQFSPCSLAPNP